LNKKQLRTEGRSIPGDVPPKGRNIAVIGMGYVGIPAAVLLANAGYNVIGIQRRSARSGWKIDWLNEGRCPIANEPELPEMLASVVKAGRFRVTDDYEVLNNTDIILIDVQTPTDSNHIPQYESLREVSRRLATYLTPGKLVIIESTVAPGTTEYLVKPILEAESGLKAGLPDGFGLCFSYERVMVGRLIHNIREYPKIVGGIDEASTKTAVEMYKSIVKGGVHGTDPMTAEISKTVENAYRDVQIAFSNEVALLCESLGTDVYEVRKFVNGLPNDPSVPHANPVRNMHFPGAGVGGHCLPKDTWLLIYGYNELTKAEGTSYKNQTNTNDQGAITKQEQQTRIQDTLRPHKYPASILEDARYLNNWMPIHMVDLLEGAIQQIIHNESQKTGQKIAIRNSQLTKPIVCVLGYAFLENSDDPRNTPTVTLLKELEKRGIQYKIHDPYVKEDEGYKIEQDLDKALKDCDAVILMTKHDEYKAVTPERLHELLRTKIVIDGRNMFDGEMFIKAGFVFRGVGKGNLNKQGNFKMEESE